MAVIYTLSDNIGSVELIDHMGSDLTVVNAARVSFHKESYEMSMGDEKLISYLAKHNHWTPFGHPQFQFRFKMPIVLARQWFKHNVGLVRNEVSRRYVTEEPEFYVPTEWRLAATNKKQGSSDEIHKQSSALTAATATQNRLTLELYKALLESNIAPEQARTVLPVSMYTEWIETGSLAAYARICSLRDQPDAQLEIQAYAKAVSALIQPICPISWEALRGN